MVSYEKYLILPSHVACRKAWLDASPDYPLFYYLSVSGYASRVETEIHRVHSFDRLLTVRVSGRSGYYKYSDMNSTA